jgi:cytochrome c oxidase subunit III
MATTVTDTKTVTRRGSGGGPKFPKPNGNGSRKAELFNDPARRYRIGMWVAMASIMMLFTALSSAYIVRAASANDWQPLAMPRVLLLSTALILISSATVEKFRRHVKALAISTTPWLLTTVVLGIGFLGSQYMAWRQLARQGLFLATSPHSSFFYLLTAVHGLHLFGGLLGLLYVLVRLRTRQLIHARQVGLADAVTIYWHFMGALWIYLFLLLFLWR